VQIIKKRENFLLIIISFFTLPLFDLYGLKLNYIGAILLFVYIIFNIRPLLFKKVLVICSPISFTWSLLFLSFLIASLTGFVIYDFDLIQLFILPLVFLSLTYSLTEALHGNRHKEIITSYILIFVPIIALFIFISYKTSLLFFLSDYLASYSQGQPIFISQYFGEEGHLFHDGNFFGGIRHTLGMYTLIGYVIFLRTSESKTQIYLISFLIIFFNSILLSRTVILLLIFSVIMLFLFTTNGKDFIRKNKFLIFAFFSIFIFFSVDLLLSRLSDLGSLYGRIDASNKAISAIFNREFMPSISGISFNPHNFFIYSAYFAGFLGLIFSIFLCFQLLFFGVKTILDRKNVLIMILISIFVARLFLSGKNLPELSSVVALSFAYYFYTVDTLKNNLLDTNR